MYIPMHFEGVTIVSRRRDIVEFYKHFIDLKFPFKIIDDLEENYQIASTVVLFDISSLVGKNFDEFKLQYSDEFFRRLIFIVPMEFFTIVQEILINQTKYSIPYPCNGNFVKKYIEAYIQSYLSKDSSIDESSLPSVFSAEALLKTHLQGESELMRVVREKILKFSRRDSPVLLLGESGTGKSTAANILHQLSYRGKNKFIRLNVSTIPDPMADTTLFGTAEGAYTDAKIREGMFKAANGGTLFLDEIGTASLQLQAKLLTVIESGMIFKVGSDKPEKVDVRLIFATNENLKANIQTGLFRHDLYYRINSNILTIPPLRERREDIILLSQKMAQKGGKYLAYGSVRKLEEYSWPGNIRELQNCMNRAISNSSGDVIEADAIVFDSEQ